MLWVQAGETCPPIAIINLLRGEKMEWPICETTENLVRQKKCLEIELQSPELPVHRQKEAEALLNLIDLALRSRIQKVNIKLLKRF